MGKHGRKKTRGAPKKAAAKRLRRPPRAAQPMTDAQDRRYSLMRRAGIDQTHIVELLKARGVALTRQSVSNVIRNKFVNESVIAAFCKLTKSTRADAWPDVPPLTPAKGAPTAPPANGDDDVAARLGAHSFDSAHDSVGGADVAFERRA